MTMEIPAVYQAKIGKSFTFENECQNAPNPTFLASEGISVIKALQVISFF